MSKEQVVVGLVIQESLSFIEVCNQYYIPKELLIDMMEQGIFSPNIGVSEARLNPRDIHKMESAFRLHRDLEVNLPGVALALELLDEIEELRKELEILHKHF